LLFSSKIFLKILYFFLGSTIPQSVTAAPSTKAKTTSVPLPSKANGRRRKVKEEGTRLDHHTVFLETAFLTGEAHH
jgi:hypothetical protein